MRAIPDLMVALKDLSQAFLSGEIVASTFVALVRIRLIAIVSG
jgi:hypothetical protein